MHLPKKLRGTNGITALILAVGAGLPHFCASAQGSGVKREQAERIAREWIGDSRVEHAAAPRSAPGWSPLGRVLAAWSFDISASDGCRHVVEVDAATGVVLSWSKRSVRGHDSATDTPPALTLEQSRHVAETFAATRHPSFATGEWSPALGSPLKGNQSFQWAWDEVLDPVTGALGPSELFVEVSDQTPEVIAFYRPPQASIVISTSPRLSRETIRRIALQYAPLDPSQYPVNRIALRVQMDDYGVQRLVWECLQVLDVSVDTGVMMYGVVHDAHTGEPLYPIAPFGGGKHQMRPIRFPKRASVQVEPGRRALSTQLSPPVLGRDGLWLRAEHLRAVEGIRVDVTRDVVAVHVGGKTLNQSDLRAEWRDYGWWVPLRHVAKLLGWQVDWNNAKKEATIRTGG